MEVECAGSVRPTHTKEYLMRHSASIIGSVAAVALTALLAAAPASAQSIVSPVAVPVNTLGDFDGTADILQTIDHSGLSSNFISGVTNFNTYIGTNPTHTTSFSGNEWFSPIGV